MKKLNHSLLFILLLTFSCGGGTQYKDASQDKGSREWGPKEIKTTVDKMVTSLHKFLKKEWKKPALLQVRRIRNRTSEHIDSRMLSESITTTLIKKRIQFVDDAYTKEQLSEIEKGMTGMVDPEYAIEIGGLRSPNFFLYGEISDNVRHVGGKRIQYLVVTLTLKDLRTGILQWQEQQEFLKATKTKNYGW